MENKAGNSSPFTNRSKKFNEENSDSLWSLFDVRLPALCQKLLTENQSKYPQVTGQGRPEQNYIDLRPGKPRLITVKSAKCQADLITHFQVPKEMDTALATVSRPKRRRKAMEMKTLPSEGNADQKTSDIRLPDLDFNENGAGMKRLDAVKNGIGSGMKRDDSQEKVGLMKREEEKIRTGNIKDGVEIEVHNVDKIGANGGIAAQFRGQLPRERTTDTRNSTAKTRCQNKLSETEYPREQGKTVNTSQISETQCLKVHINSIADTTEISEPECLKEQTIITVDMNQIPVSGLEFSKEWKHIVPMSKLSETEKLDHTPEYKKHKSRTERRRAEVQNNHRHNNASETEPTKTLNTCINFTRHRDQLISEPNRNNKSERDGTEELDISINYKNTASETSKTNAIKIEYRESQDSTINDNSTSETDKNNLSETVCTEELDNATNERISKEGCKEEQENIANDETNVSETILAEQQNNLASFNNSVSEMHENNANEMYKDNITHRNNTSETEFTEKLDNTSKKSKTNLRDSSETAYVAEWDMHTRLFKLKLDETKETSDTLKPSQHVKIKEKCSPQKETTSQMLKLDEQCTRELAKQKESSNSHKTGETETNFIAWSPTRKHKHYDKSQQHECRTREKNDKTETDSEAQQEQEMSECKCRLEHDISQPEHRREPKPNTEQTECRKKNDISQPQYREEKYDISRPEYTKEPKVITGKIQCRKQDDISQPQYREEKYDISRPEYTKEPKVITGKIQCRKQADISQPQYREEKYDTSRPEYTKEPKVITGKIQCRKQDDIIQPQYREEKYDISQSEYTKEPKLNTGQLECRKQDQISQPKYRTEKELDTEQIEHIKEHDVSQQKHKEEHKTFQPECIKEVESNDEDNDNDWKLVTQENLETDERQNNASATGNYDEQKTTYETTDLKEATSVEQESKRASSEAKSDQEKTKEIIKWKNRKSANNKAKIETNTDIIKRDDISNCSESYPQTTVLPKQLPLSDYRPQAHDHRNTEKQELPDLECQEVSNKLPTRNENVIHQVAEKCNTETHLPPFEEDTQAIITGEPSPLCSILAKTVAVSDFLRKANLTNAKDSTNNNDSTSCAGNEILVLLPPVCNKVAKKLNHSISEMCSRSSCVTAVASNCTKTPPKENTAFIQMISRQLSAYILDRKTNTVKIVPLDSSINYTVEQEDSGSAVFSEDIHFQNGRLLCQNSEARPRRVSSTDCRYFQSNTMEKLHSGSSRRSKSECLTRRCALNKEWEVLTKTTREELIIFSQPKQSSRKIRETVSSQESHPKSSVNINSSKLQNREALQAQQVVHESIHLQPFCPSISADKKSDGYSKQTELGFSQSQLHQELSVNNRASIEKPICCSRGTKTGNDVPGSGAVQTSAIELVGGAMQQCTKELKGNSMSKDLETQICPGKSNCSSFDMNTSNKLTTKTLQQCDEPNMISWGKTNKNPWQLQILPEICMNTNHEEFSFGSTAEQCFKTDTQMSEFCGCDTEILADLNSKHQGSTKTERGYHSEATELSLACSAETPNETKFQESHLIGDRDKSNCGKLESFSRANIPVCSDFVEVIDLTNFKMKDVVTQCKTYESREVFTQTDANNFTQQRVTQHKEHSTSDPPWHSETEKTKFKDGNFAVVDNTGLQQSVYPRVYPTKYTQDEKTKNKVEKLDSVQSYMTNNSTSTDCSEALQTEISFGGLIAKELAGYIFHRDKRNSRLPCRTKIKNEIKRSSSLSDVQTDLQNTLVISEKLRTLLETGQTVLVFKLPPSDNC